MNAMTRLRTSAALALGAATLLTAGCGGEGGSGSGEESPNPSASPPEASSSEPAPQAVPPLTFVKEAEPGDCYAIGGKSDTAEVAWFGSVVNVTASGRLVGVRAVNSPGVQLRVEDTQQVPLAGRVDKVGAVGDWPLTSDQVTRFLVVRDASDLFQQDLRANQSILPVLHLTVQPDSSVEEFVFEYEIANGQLAEVTYPVELEFAKNCSKSGGSGKSGGNEDGGNGSGDSSGGDDADS